MAVFLARMVMPRSRSNSLESITRSTWVSLARKVPLWFSMASTRAVFPWSTCAMMAMLRILLLKTNVLPGWGKPRATRQTEGFGFGVFSLQYEQAFGVSPRKQGARTAKNAVPESGKEHDSRVLQHFHSRSMAYLLA